MAYDCYFQTGAIRSGTKFIARYDGEFVGNYATWSEANAALKVYARKKKRTMSNTEGT